jgi:hypothetical protein
VPNQTLVVALHLLASCSAVACEDSQTCTERGCESAMLNPDELPVWTGTLPKLPGNGPQLDGGSEELDASRLDASDVRDAATQLDAADADGPTDATVTDTSTRDAASSDAAADAATDAGTDAATDAGTDAATDAGTDASLTECGGDAGLVDLTTNVNHCTKCNKPCTGSIPSYFNVVWGCRSDCVYLCAPLYGNCDGSNTNGCEKHLIYDSANCGACGFKCLVGEICSSQGRCVAP